MSSTEIYGKEAEEFSASNIYASNSTTTKKKNKKGEREKKALHDLFTSKHYLIS